MFRRVREIVDPAGERLRVSVDMLAGRAVTIIDLPSRGKAPPIVLSAYGTELLGGYIMSARLALPHGLPDEHVAGGCATRFELVREPLPSIRITQNGCASGVEIAHPFWDKLYAELCMVIAHSRQLGAQASISIH